jgi:hypothetical protein
MQSEERDVKNDAGVVMEVKEARPGIVAVQAFKTSDGKLFETHQQSREHEAFGVLKHNLYQCFTDDNEVKMILDCKESIFKVLTTYFNAVK